MPKTLVTHLFPHLDDVTGLWLLKRFDPAVRASRLKFVATSAGGIRLPKSEVGVGVGRGMYDEHKGDKKDSAASLVWKDLKRRGKLPGGIKGRALAALVDDVRRGDLGEYIGNPGNFFNLSITLQLLGGLPGESSSSATAVGFKMLDAKLGMHEQFIRVADAIKRGRHFMTRWGRGVGLVCDAVPGNVSSYAAEHGYAVVVLQHPSKRYFHVRASPRTKADLSKLAAAVRKAEPEMEWYFHHSHKMLLHGDLLAPTPKRTRYTIPSMIRLIRQLYG